MKYTLLDPKQEHYKKINATFRRRCFLTGEEQEYFISDKVRLLLREECDNPNCNKILFPKDIMKLTIKVEDGGDNNGQYIFRCSCSQ